MLKKLIIALLVCGVFLGFIRQINPMPTRSKLVNKLNKTKINYKEVKSTSASGNKFISDEIKKPRDVVIVETDPIIGDDQMKTNSISDGNYSDKNDVHDDVIIQTDAAKSRAASINFTWNGVKLIAVTTATNHSDNAQKEKTSSPTTINDTKENKDISKQQSQPEAQSDTSIKTDKVRCPSVEKIQQVAQQINDVFLQDGTYRLTTYGPAFQDSELTWLVGVKGIVADSSDEAIYKAVIAVSETNQHKGEYAEIIEGPFTLYFCSYGPSDIVAVGIRNEALVEE